MKAKYSFSKWRFWSYLSSYENFKKNGEMIEKMKKDYDQRFMLYHRIIEAHSKDIQTIYKLLTPPETEQKDEIGFKNRGK